MASFVKAASTDKDAAIPVHPGAKVYYDGEEQTFFEKYGDWVYIGPIFSVRWPRRPIAVLRFLGISGLMREPPLLAKVPEAIQAIDSARSAEELDLIRTQSMRPSNGYLWMRSRASKRSEYGCHRNCGGSPGSLVA